MTRQVCDCCLQRVLQREATNTFVWWWRRTCREPTKEKLATGLSVRSQTPSCTPTVQQASPDEFGCEKLPMRLEMRAHESHR